MANKALSIYVGSDAIRVAEVIFNGKTVTLANAAEIATPEKSVTDGYIDDVSAVSEAIRTSIFGRGFSTKDVIFTISSKKIASKEIIIPYMKNEKKMQGVLQANSVEYFPMSNTGDYAFAFSVLEDYSDAEGHKCRVSAVACPEDILKGYYEVARELKYNVKHIDYFGNSVIQLLSMQMTPGRMDLVLQIENDQTIINVMRGSTLVFQRSVPHGKNSVISSLMNVKKISEKDAKTLLSRDDYMEQYVTEDEYSAAVRDMVNGIKKAVEYYRNKHGEDNLQGIKVFGEGSAMAGIGKVLQNELGAPVEFFSSLAGVIVKGQAALKASEVLRYLPNMGAIIKPLDLTMDGDGGGGSSSVDQAAIIKILCVVFGVACVAMLGFVGYTIYDNIQATKEQERLNAEIEAIKDIEDIANARDNAKAELEVVTDFEKSTHTDNEYLLSLVEDMEKLMPKGSAIQDLEAEDGFIKFTVTSGWHPTTKNEIADVIVKLQELDYVYNFDIPSFEEKYMIAVITGIDENGNYVYLYEEDEDGIEKMVEVDKENLEEYLGEELIMLVQSEYDISLNLGYPVVEEPEEQSNEGIIVEEGGAE